MQYASNLVMAPLPCNSKLHILPIYIFDNFSKQHDNHWVRFPNWLYHPSKLFLHHRYGPLKTNMHLKVFSMLHFLLFLYK